MTMGTPDGYRLATADGSFLEGKSGALIRCRPDGSHPEVVCRGFVNLVEVAFLPGGDAIGTDNWFQEPAGGFRDALVHLVEGGLYPYVPDEGTPQPITGEPLPAVARFPAVALSGLERYRGTAFPAEYRGNLFSAQHNTRKVGRHVLVPDGSTFRSEDSDFLTSEDPDFHPSDVLEDADGSLLVVDTGAWYVQHCPTGRIRASRSRGGIYRVRRADAPGPTTRAGSGWTGRPCRPAGSRGSWPTPAPPCAIGPAASWPAAASPSIAPLGEAPARVCRRREGGGRLGPGGDPGPRRAPPAAIGPRRPGRGGGVRGRPGPGMRADRGAAADLTRRLIATAARGSGSPRPRRWRAAATERRCPPSGGGWPPRPDRFLGHALIHAAHRLADADALEAALARPEPAVQAAALLLLDQPPRPRGRLGPGPVVARASSRIRACGARPSGS